MVKGKDEVAVPISHRPPRIPSPFPSRLPEQSPSTAGRETHKANGIFREAPR